MSKARYYIPF